MANKTIIKSDYEHHNPQITISKNRVFFTQPLSHLNWEVRAKTYICNKSKYTMKSTALTSTHKALGAKMAEFAGYEMPISYEGVKAEHLTVREKIGIFDVSHMGIFIISGPNALNLMQKVWANDISKLKVGRAQYSYLPNEQGGIVDDLIAYRLEEEKYMLVPNASNIEKDWNWISKHNDVNAEMENLSDEIGIFAVQGPKAIEAMQKVTDVDLSAIRNFQFKIGEFADVEDVIISGTGYTGSGGIEVYFKKEDSEKIWKKVLEAGDEFGIQPVGLAARDTLRLEMGLCLYGNDIDDTTSPFEANLGWTTKFTKDFVNSENLKKQKEEGVDRKLVGFELTERGIPRKGYAIVDADGNNIGEVTSGTRSPSTGKSIGLGYIKKPHHQIGSEVFIKIRKKAIPAKVVKTPFL